ncbi:unnamed protein product [Hydatigera taeniaeformis]|uniref:Tub domain-containing protein n=1 Tax=Hydatigena taeniaeformis TaxID=6205 RepID=A0A158RDW4_HYDTA|nr:unnamed protein product [Hydatigera taeniaeformis]
MDATSAKGAAQRRLKLEKQKKRQHKHAHEVQSLQTRSFNALVDLGPIIPRSSVKTPSRGSQTSVSENFGEFFENLFILLEDSLLFRIFEIMVSHQIKLLQNISGVKFQPYGANGELNLLSSICLENVIVISAYDGPQAFELGNPDLLDPPIQVLRVSGDRDDAATPAIATSKSSSRENTGTSKTYQAIHIPPIRPVKLPLPKTPLTGTDRRSLFESMELEEVEEDVSTAAVKLRSKVGRRKVRSATHRQSRTPLRPHSAMEASQRPQVKTNNLIDFDKADSVAMETSVVSATAVRSVTPSTASAVSYQWVSSAASKHEKPNFKNLHSKGKGNDLSGENAVRSKRKNPAKKGTLSEVSVTRRSKKKVAKQQRPERLLRRQELSRSTDHLTTKDKRAHKRDGVRSTDDTERKVAGAVSQGTLEKSRSSKPRSPRRAAHVRDDAVQSNLGADLKTPQVKMVEKINQIGHPTSPVLSAGNRKYRKEAGSPTKRTNSKGREKVVSSKDDLVHDEPIRSTLTRIFSAGDDVEAFITTPAAKGVTVCCRISRDKHGIEGGLFPSYFLHLERQEDGRRFFLLAARRKRRTTTCNYLISLDATATSSPLNAPGDGRLTVGNLRSNFLGTQFVLLSTRSRYIGPYASTGHHDVDLASGDWSKEIATISYEPNILGFKGPRRMTVLLPSVVEPIDSKTSNELSRYATGGPEARNDSSGIMELHNKKPMWNEGNVTHFNLLDPALFWDEHSGVGIPLTKRSKSLHQAFLLIQESTILMQFGRVSSDVFTMDYTYPLTALQAFGIAISSLTGKLACE